MTNSSAISVVDDNDGLITAKTPCMRAFVLSILKTFSLRFKKFNEIVQLSMSPVLIFLNIEPGCQPSSVHCVTHIGWLGLGAAVGGYG